MRIKVKPYSHTLWIFLAGTILLLFPLITPPYYQQLGCVAGVFAILVLGYDFVLGRAGQFSFGHIAFFGIGAYTSALLSVNCSVSFWLALPAAALISSLFGLLIGIPVLRLRGPYLAIATLGFAEIVRLILTRWDKVTRGVDGIAGIKAPAIGPLVFDNTVSFYYVILFWLGLVVLIAERIHRGKYGRLLKAIRENELAAEAMGIDTSKGKVMAFVLSALYAGVAGSLYAHLFSYISPETFDIEHAIIVLYMLIIGGAGSTAGAILGAVLLTFLPEWLRFLKDYYLLLYGMGIILMMIFMPYGVIGLVHRVRLRMTLNR